MSNSPGAAPVDLNSYQLYRYSIVWNACCADEHAEVHHVFAKDLAAARGFASAHIQRIAIETRPNALYSPASFSWNDVNETWCVGDVSPVRMLEERLPVAGIDATVSLEQVALHEDPTLRSALHTAVLLLDEFSHGDHDDWSVGRILNQVLEMDGAQVRQDYERLAPAIQTIDAQPSGVAATPVQ